MIEIVPGIYRNPNSKRKQVYHGLFIGDLDVNKFIFESPCSSYNIKPRQCKEYINSKLKTSKLSSQMIKYLQFILDKRGRGPKNVGHNRAIRQTQFILEYLIHKKALTFVPRSIKKKPSASNF